MLLAGARVGVTTMRAEPLLSLLGCRMSQIARRAPRRRATREPRYRVKEGTPLAGSRQTLQKSSPCSSQ